MTTEEMIQLNREQARFYDTLQEAELDAAHRGYAKNRASNVLTRVWADMRYRQQEALRQAGIEGKKEGAHHDWIRPKRGGDFLEIGCFSGSVFTFQLIEASGRYLGVELSSKAAETLKQKIANLGLEHKAQVQAMDFLLLPETAEFDVIFAHGVLHHFENPEPLFGKIARLLKADGILVLTEPSAINPVYRSLRALYRPFQSDRAWEWPFTNLTIETLERYLVCHGGFGWGRWSLPLSVFVSLPVVGRMLVPLYVWLVRAEVGRGWDRSVWQNSYVTAVYGRRSEPNPGMHARDPQRAGGLLGG